MSVLYVKTVGRVYPLNELPIGLNVKNNLTRDWLGFPWLPMNRLLKDQCEFRKGARIGFGRLAGRDALAQAVSRISDTVAMFPNFVLDRFTDLVPLGESSCYVLKPGLTFVCPIEVPDAQRREFQKALEAVTTIGATFDGVTGEVELQVKWGEAISSPREKMALQPKLRYTRLNFSIRTVTPLCACLPYDGKSKAESFIPGTLLREWLRERLGEEYAAFAALGHLDCANAYPSCKGRRGLWIPACMSQRKNDPEIAVYRLAKDFEKENSEITAQMNTFVADPLSAEPECFGVSQRTIYPLGASADEPCGTENRRRALSEDLVFRGYFEGSDQQIRTIKALIEDDPRAMLGFYTQDGFGETVIRVETVEAEKEAAEQLARRFDLLFVSDAVFYNAFGVPVCDSGRILEEVERILGCPGQLRIAGRSTNTALRHPIDFNFALKDAVERTVAAGSVLRLETKDGQPIDVSALNGAFLGDGATDGSGEVLVLPASDRILRYVREAKQDKFDTVLQLGLPELRQGADLVHGITETILRNRVTLLALNDARNGETITDEDLEFLLGHMSANYGDVTDVDTMIRWYREAVRIRG